MATTSKKVAASLDGQYSDSGQYYRFNVDRGLEDVTLSDWEKSSKISAHTGNYLRENQNQRAIRRCEKVALVGLGGIGKTQVALQFAYWMKKNKPEYSIFWVSALSNDTFEQSYAEIARELDIRTNADEKDLKELVCRHLSSEAAGRWLFVLDNADDIDVLFGSSHKLGGIHAHIPENENGLILLTTRSKEAALSDEAATEELLRALNYIPLAITQGAAYLNQNQLSIQRYLELLQGTEQNMVSLMTREFHDNTRYRGSQNAVASTWLVSFDQIRKSDRLLPTLQLEVEIENAIGTLCGYAFLVKRGEGDMFDMHSLVHVATRIWIQSRGLSCQTTVNAIYHLATIFPSSNFANRELWRKYLPHTLRLLQKSEDYRVQEKYDLYWKVGRCLYMDRRFKEVVRCFEEVSKWESNHLAEEDDSRLTSEHELARAYLADRRIKEAIEILEHVVAVRRKTLAEEDDSRLTSEHELARAYLADRRIKEAIEILEHVVAVRRKTLAEEDDSRLAFEHALAEAYRSQCE
ncbi:uncharacterized protein BCR38DRAFT_517816 [Pseudomassariella vexata]|uniref:NB-ARC domain-containing protein n=1 Tax=Pseudomassariella vexata TaxID=1141098 RepID=A0A1Y2DUN8_9PEZI|nr:uncharacterized protein BCR38DRAFT_517816 [Pseudomassariella vexata]ORY62365.1 hypothetical protein BCR38DRAFT_517816 [Pseudomassariella vexata]